MLTATAETARSKKRADGIRGPVDAVAVLQGNLCTRDAMNVPDGSAETLSGRPGVSHDMSTEIQHSETYRHLERAAEEFEQQSGVDETKIDRVHERYPILLRLTLTKRASSTAALDPIIKKHGLRIIETRSTLGRLEPALVRKEELEYMV